MRLSDRRTSPGARSTPPRNVGRRAGENYKWLKEVTEGDEQIGNRTTRLVLFAIHSFMDKNGHCFPTYPQIARRAGVAKRTAQTHVGRLVKLGWLLRHSEVRPNGQWGNNRYDSAYPPDYDKQFSEERPPP